MRLFTRPAKAGILAVAVILVGSAALAQDARRFETDFGDPIGNLSTAVAQSALRQGGTLSITVEQSEFKWAELSGSTEESNLRGN